MAREFSPTVRALRSGAAAITASFGGVAGAASASSSYTSPDIGPERRVLNRAAFGPSPNDLVHIQSLGWQAWLEEQLAFSSIDDLANEALVQQAIGGQSDYNRLTRAYIQRCLGSRRQLQMKMTTFWENHFNTNRRVGLPDNEIFEHELFRKRAFGRFEDLLIASAQSPAMIRYLDNQSNVAGSPNENYAREVLELHTLGVDGPYTEMDVAALARVFTGWRVVNNPVPTGIYRPHVFDFRVSTHDSGPKTVMTWSTAGFGDERGLTEGVDFLRYLARHPKTIDYISRKLCASFLDATPQEAHVTRVKNALGRPDATIADALRIIFSIIADSRRQSRTRSQSNIEFMISAHRRLGLTTANLNRIRNEMSNLGSPLFEYPAPTGPADSGPDFENPGTQIVRWNFIHDLARNSIGSSTVNYTTLLGAPAPATVTALIDHVADVVVDGDIDSKSRQALATWIEGRIGSSPTQGQIDSMAPELTSLLFRLPSAQLN